MAAIVPDYEISVPSSKVEIQRFSNLGTTYFWGNCSTAQSLKF